MELLKYCVKYENGLRKTGEAQMIFSKTIDKVINSFNEIVITITVTNVNSYVHGISVLTYLRFLLGGIS